MYSVCVWTIPVSKWTYPFSFLWQSPTVKVRLMMVNEAFAEEDIVQRYSTRTSLVSATPERIRRYLIYFRCSLHAATTTSRFNLYARIIKAMILWIHPFDFAVEHVSSSQSKNSHHHYFSYKAGYVTGHLPGDWAKEALFVWDETALYGSTQYVELIFSEQFL